MKYRKLIKLILTSTFLYFFFLIFSSNIKAACSPPENCSDSCGSGCGCTHNYCCRTYTQVDGCCIDSGGYCTDGCGSSGCGCSCSSDGDSDGTTITACHNAISPKGGSFSSAPGLTIENCSTFSVHPKFKVRVDGEDSFLNTGKMDSVTIGAGNQYTYNIPSAYLPLSENLYEWEAKVFDVNDGDNKTEYSHEFFTICSAPSPPTGLTASCDNCAGTDNECSCNISWNDSSGATGYAIRVTDGDNIDNSADTSLGIANNCPEPASSELDICINGWTKTSMEVDTTRGESYSIWVHSTNSCGWSSASWSNMVCNNCIPNCKSLSGDNSVCRGEVANFTSTHEDPPSPSYGSVTQAGLTIYSGSDCSNIATGGYLTQAGTAGNYNWSWTPDTALDYTVYCRTWNDAIAECRGDCVDGWPRADCAGPLTSMTLSVDDCEITNAECGSFTSDSITLENITWSCDTSADGMFVQNGAFGASSHWTGSFSNTHTISGLDPNTSYSFNVACYRDTGTGQSYIGHTGLFTCSTGSAPAGPSPSPSPIPSPSPSPSPPPPSPSPSPSPLNCSCQEDSCCSDVGDCAGGIANVACINNRCVNNDCRSDIDCVCDPSPSPSPSLAPSPTCDDERNCVDNICGGGVCSIYQMEEECEVWWTDGSAQCDTNTYCYCDPVCCDDPGTVTNIQFDQDCENLTISWDPTANTDMYHVYEGGTMGGGGNYIDSVDGSDLSPSIEYTCSSAGSRTFYVYSENDCGALCPSEYEYSTDTHNCTESAPNLGAAFNMNPCGDIQTDEISLTWNSMAASGGDWGCNLNGNDNCYIINLDGSEVMTTQSPFDYSYGPDTYTWGQTYTWEVIASNDGCSTPVANEHEDSDSCSFTPYTGPWFQTAGGDVYGNNVYSSIPIDTCSGACVPALLLTDSGSHGTFQYTNNYDLGDGGLNNIADDGDNWKIQTNIDYGINDYGYDFWEEFLREDLETSTDFDRADGDIDAFLNNDPANNGVYNMTTNSLNGHINSNQWVVLLRNGNMTITNELTVDEGGFLMVIANGEINIASSISGTELSPGIEGVFIGNSINTLSGSFDAHLWAEGIFVGWNGISLARDYETNTNDTEPTETFTYRPDFIFNAPKEVKKVIFYQWEEEAP